MNGPILNSLIPVISYPGSDYQEVAQSTLRLMEVLSPSQATTFRSFVDSLEGQSAGELEEAYIRTFDLNPDACLDLGWHLHGETYERGSFLVTMRQLLAEHGVAESSELPDHLTHFLALIPLLAEPDAEELVERCLPAIDKIKTQLEQGDSPYKSVLDCVFQLLQNRPEPQRS